jgi:hypothetical protein
LKFYDLKKLPAVFIFTSLLSCGGGGGGGGGGGSDPVTPVASCTLGTGASLNVSGAITFERIALLDSGALDFSSVTSQSASPAKAIRVEAVCNSVIAVVTTDDNGLYTLAVPSGTQGVFIRAKAQMIKSGAPSWDVEVRDASQISSLVFALDSSPFNLDGLDVTKNLLAAAGNIGSTYPVNAVRAAAPFAILDSIYKSMQLVLSVEPNAIFPALDVKWSSDNQDGTYYSNNQISVLGSTVDTDEFDEHVIVHEWGHYFQDAFSRDNSFGGSHAAGDILDIRVAFSEGFGNAFSAMVTGDPVYKDSQGTASGFTIDVESNDCINEGWREGWYSECSVQSVLYDFFDASNDDTFSLGFDEIYDVMTSNMPTSNALTSLFSFINPFKNLASVVSADVDALLAVQSIDSISDDYATGVSAGMYTGVTDVLPLYDTRAFSLTDVCSTGDNISAVDVYGLGVSRFIRFTAPSTGSFRFTSSWTSGLSASDPDMYLYSNGTLVGSAVTTINKSETFITSLVAGNEYILEVLEYTYVDSQIPYNRSAAGAINETCFTVSRTPI